MKIRLFAVKFTHCLKNVHISVHRKDKIEEGLGRRKRRERGQRGYFFSGLVRVKDWQRGRVARKGWIVARKGRRVARKEWRVARKSQSRK